MKTRQKFKYNLIKSGSRTDRFLERQFGSTLFTYGQIFSMLLPLVLDQLFINLIGVLTTGMISSSSQESVSAVSLVGPLNMMAFSIYTAISAGGTVIVAQYKGRGDEEKIRNAAGQVMLATSSTAILLCIGLIIFADPLIHFMFGAADPIIIKKATDYIVGVAISMMFHAMFVGAFAVLRGIGETKLCLHLTLIVNFLHLIASMIFINVLKLDIIGTALSLNIARFVGAAVAIWSIMKPTSVVRVSLKNIFHVNWSVLKSIYKVGIPFALEQVFFNGGSILVQTYIVTLGTLSVSANAITNSAVSILYSASSAVGTLAITVIGQCIGANMKDLAKRYAKKMIWLGTAIVCLSLLIFLPCMPWILKLYNAPDNTLSLIYQLIIIAAIPIPFFWSLSTIIPCILRSAGDANFTSIVSLITMWVLRVGLGKFLAINLGLGVHGVWISLGVEWAVRSLIFYLRFSSGIWLTKKAIE